MRSAHYIRLEEERCRRRRLTVGIIIITHEPTHTETRSACRRNSTYYIYIVWRTQYYCCYFLYFSLSLGLSFLDPGHFFIYFFFFTVITYCSVPAHTFVIIASPPHSPLVEHVAFGDRSSTATISTDNRTERKPRVLRARGTIRVWFTWYRYFFYSLAPRSVGCFLVKIRNITLYRRYAFFIFIFFFFYRSHRS